MTVVAVTLAVLAGPVDPPVELGYTDHDQKLVSQVCRRECRQRRRCNRRGDVDACITRAADRHNVSEWMLRRKAWCESRMNPRAYNASSGASGLFQFLPSTWWTTPYAPQSIWSARWNSLAAAWMHRVGRGGEWACQ